MNQEVTDQRTFAFMSEAVPPELAPVDKVAEFETEVQAINFSIDHVMRQRGGLTQMTLADDMKISRAVLTKIKQGQASIPVGKFLTFIETTRSHALIQFYAMRLGLVLKTREAHREDQRELQVLREEVTQLRKQYSRVVGE